MEPARLGRALVTGATGFVGNHVARALLDRGQRVRCLVRPSSRRDLLGGLDVEIAEGDIRDGDSVLAAVTGCDVVYHCAADYRLWVPDPPAMYATNVGGTENVMCAALQRGVARVVYTSTVGALGRGPDGAPADETATATANITDMIGHYKRSKWQAERVAEDWTAKGLDVVTVLPTAPVGDGDLKPTATGQMIVDFLRGKIPAFVDTGLNLVDVRDVAAGHLLAAEKGRTGERYILGNRNMTLQEILDELAVIAGRPAPRRRIPHWVAFTYAALETGWARLRGRAPAVPLDAVRMARHRMWFDAGKAVRELGLPQTPVEDALRRAVTWFRDHGHA